MWKMLDARTLLPEISVQTTWTSCSWTPSTPASLTSSTSKAHRWRRCWGPMACAACLVISLKPHCVSLISFPTTMVTSA